MRERRSIKLLVALDARPVSSETTCVWVGPYVLTVSTVLPDPGLAVEVHSSFVGHAGVPVCVTHLTLGPVGHEPTITQVEHEHASLDPTLKARECAYEHIQIVLETLKRLGHQVAIDVPNDAFRELERIEL